MPEEHPELVIHSLCLSAINASGSCGWFLLAYVTKLGKRTCVLEHLRNFFFHFCFSKANFPFTVQDCVTER